MNWTDIFNQEKEKQYYINLQDKLNTLRKKSVVYPNPDQVFNAFEMVSFEDVKVVILGQDPYHQVGQAMGLSFSVNKDMKLPKSLINIFKELESDLGVVNHHGDLSAWAKQGVLLLNTILTVEESKPLSHKNIGWEVFTDRIISELGKREDPIVFILWGNNAKKKRDLIKDHHFFIESSHPSPLGAYRGFIGSKPFSKTNEYLKQMGKQVIDWRNYV